MEREEGERRTMHVYTVTNYRTGLAGPRVLRASPVGLPCIGRASPLHHPCNVCPSSARWLLISSRALALLVTVLHDFLFLP